MTEPNANMSIEDRVERVEGELQSLAQLVVSFTEKIAALTEVLERRVTTSTLPPELQVRPGLAGRPTARLSPVARPKPTSRGKDSDVGPTHTKDRGDREHR